MAPTPVSANGTKVTYNAVDMSDQITRAEPKYPTQYEDATPYQPAAATALGDEYAAPTINGFRLELEGFFNATTKPLKDAQRGGLKQAFEYYPQFRGQSAGSRMKESGSCWVEDFQIKGTSKGIQMFSCTLRGDGPIASVSNGT